jgi:hypothetical protein
MLATSRKDEQGFCFWGDGFCRPVEQYASKPFCDRGTPWFSREEHVVPIVGEHLAES